MKPRSTVILLVLAGILGIAAALWSWSGEGIGPVRQGTGEPISQITRNMIMILTLIGSFGSFVVAVFIKAFGNKTLGIFALIFASCFIPAFFQANLLSILAFFLLFIVGLTLLMKPLKNVPEF